MEFQVCFTFAKYGRDMLLLCETINVFIDGFRNSRIHFHQLGPFKLIQTMLKSLNILQGLSPVWNHYPNGSHNTRDI